MAGCTVTATLNTILGDVISSGAFVKFRLRNFSGAVPRVNGTAILIQPDRDVFPDSNGNISTELWGNDSITPDATFYSVDFYNNGKICASGNYIVTGSTFDLDVQDPVSTPSPKYPFQLVLETNGVANPTQRILNLVAGTNMTATAADDGSGDVTLSSSGSGGGGIGKVTTSFTGTPTFTPTSQICIVQITLGGNVSSSTFNAASISANAFILMQIIQDATGGRTFVFPTNFLNAGGVGSAANQTTFQLFYWDGTNCYAVTPPTVYP